MKGIDSSDVRSTEKPQLSETTSQDTAPVESAVNLASADEIAFLAKILGFSEKVPVQLEDEGFQILVAGISQLAYEESREIVGETLKDFDNDRNFPSDLRSHMEHALAVDPKEVIETGITAEYLTRACAGIMRFSSPYPEVRANTYFTDKDEHCETFRAYLISAVWVAVYAFVAQFFEIRLPGITLRGGILMMFVVPCGMFLAKVLPDWGFTFRGTRYTLNPGPWSYKEQSFVTLVFAEMSVASVDSQVLVQKLPIFYGQSWANAGYQICLLLSTQYIGFGLAGIFRNIVVYPVQNLFMLNFPALALNRALLKPSDKKPVHGWKMSTWQFLGLTFAIVFVWEWLPLYLMQFLSFFNWMCWIAPDNFNLAAVTGFESGLGFNPIPSFDFNYIFDNVSPVFSMVNQYVGTVLGGLVIIGVYYSNMYNTAYLPINSNSLFSNTGERYNVHKILDKDGLFDVDMYQKYSPPFYTAANLVTYGAFFASYTCLIVNTILYDWKIMLNAYTQFFKSLFGKHKTIKEFNDPHCRMMARYPETPQWWFFVILLISLALALATIKGFPTETPVWALFMALGITLIFLVPVSILTARTNTRFTTDVLVELIMGYAAPGHGIAMMLIKAYGVNSLTQANFYLSDLKFAHYSKIPPRSAFRGQLWGTLVSLFVVFGVMQFQLTGIDDICSPKLIQTNKFVCPLETTNFSASVIWGIIGPKRIFESQYPILKWCFLIGAGIPIPLYILRWIFPRLRHKLLLIDPNLIIIGLHNYAPMNLCYVTGKLYTNLLFMGFIRRRYVKWFEKYNYVLSSSVNAALSLCAFIVFFAVQYNYTPLHWWGNDVNAHGADALRLPRLQLPAQGYFGAAPGNYTV